MKMFMKMTPIKVASSLGENSTDKERQGLATQMIMSVNSKMEWWAVKAHWLTKMDSEEEEKLYIQGVSGTTKGMAKESLYGAIQDPEEKARCTKVFGIMIKE